MRGLWPFSLWYILGLVFVVIGLFPFLGVPWVFLSPVLPGVLLLAWTAWHHWQCARSPGNTARAEIEQVLSRHGEATWVSSDRHVRLTAYRLFWSAWQVHRADDDQAAYIDDPGCFAITLETFMFTRFCARVPRSLDGALITGGRHVKQAGRGREQTIRWYPRANGILGAGKDAYDFADAGELAELAAQLRAGRFTPSRPA